MRQSTADPTNLAWEFFSGPFNYDATPLGPLGIRVISHDKPLKRKSWGFRGKDGWSIGVSLEHYLCQRFIPKDSRALSISDTIKFHHQHLTQPSVTAKDRVLHGMQQLTSVLQKSPSSHSSAQLEAIQALHNTLGKWSGDNTTNQEPSPPPVPTIKDRRDEPLSPRMRQPSPRVEPLSPRAQPPPPRVLPPALPRVQMPVESNTQPVAARTRSRQKSSTLKPTTLPDKPVAHRTHSRKIEKYLTINPAQAYQRKYSSKLIQLWCTPLPPDIAAMPVLDKETIQTLEFRKLHTHPKYKETWNTSYCNELGGLRQGVGHGTAGPQQQRV